MKELNLNPEKFGKLLNAFNFYAKGEYNEALISSKQYRENSRDYIRSLVVNSSLSEKLLTVIVVTHDGTSTSDLDNCLRSINKGAKGIQIIILNNGLKTRLNNYCQMYSDCILRVNINCNILPSEARNIGAQISNSKWIYFIDDDAILDTTYNEIFDILKTDFHAARGSVKAKNSELKIPNHYHLGKFVFPNELNIEGNLLIRRSLFLCAGGFDPLLFSHEGKDLTKNIYSLIAKEEVLYHPKLAIKHNPTFGEKLIAKKARNMKSNKYLEFKDNLSSGNIKGLFFVFIDVINDEIIKNIEHIKAQYSEILIDFILISKNPHEVLCRIKDNDLRFRSIVISEHYYSFTHLNERGYSFIAAINPLVRLEISEVKKSISTSLINGNISNILNSGYLIALDKLQYASIKISAKIPELIQRFKENCSLEKTSIKLKSNIISNTKKDVIFISFHTTDEYYSKQANHLRNCLDRLGLNHDIQPFAIPSGMEWPDICRKKVSFYYNLFEKHSVNFKKIVWIDADCNLNYMPSFIFDFDVDFMAFRRGFPHTKHIDRNLTRHWEPCFLVFKANSACHDFLKFASDLEMNSPDIRATDDYFFEEAWRKFGSRLTVFEIPGEMSSRGAKFKHNQIECRKFNIFFNFGDSGHVADFKGLVIQHQKMDIPIDTKLKVQEKTISGLDVLIKISKDNRSLLFQPNETFGRGYDENSRELVKSLYEYQFDDNAIRLNWWIRPAPGNMGDWLSPYIVHKITGKSIRYSPASQAKMISLGSIGKFISDHHVVWGTGISSRNTILNSKARYLAVRGPLTAEALINSGGTSPNIFGDPGIIMPHLYKSNKKSGSDYGLVRHFIHQDCDMTIEKGIRDINILLSSKNDIECFIDQLHECKAIITTSLHVVILCISYGIPCRLISIDEKDKGVHGDGVKYEDFYEGVNLTPRRHFYTGNIITRGLIEDIVFDDNLDQSLPLVLKKALTDDLLFNPERYR